jgi:hypothetical protein
VDIRIYSLTGYFEGSAGSPAGCEVNLKAMTERLQLECGLVPKFVCCFAATRIAAQLNVLSQL